MDNKNCKYCGKKIKENNFCSVEHRNNYVSELMIEKAKDIKRTIGNKYYGKQKEDNCVK